MKHKYVSLFALACAMFVSTGAMAQWTEPEQPGTPDPVEFVAGGTYFVRNVGAGQFLTYGNAWGTQISLTMDGLYDEANKAIALDIAEATETLGGASVSGYKLQLHGTYTGKTNTFFFRDSEGDGFIDYNNQGRGVVWNITKVGDYYRIQTASGDPAYPNSATQYAGWPDEGVPFEEGTSTVVKFDLTEEEPYIDWEFISADEAITLKEAYAARVELYEALLSTLDLGYTVDTSAATAVYNNANATKEQLEAATAKLKYDINAKKYEEAWADASEDNPLDVTEDCLENPTFDSNIDGWTITVGGQNLQWQARTDGQVNEENNWVSITNFIEAWRPNDQGGLGDGTISQTVYGLPAGKYVLECDAMATRQGGLNGLSAEDAVEGAFIFIQGENHEVREPIKAPDTQPKHWSVVFVNDDSHWLTFGLKVENTTANWISADNFKLTYYGKTEDTPELVILKEELKKAQELAEESEENNIESTDNINYSAEARSGLAAAITAGEAAISGDAAAQTAATEALKDAVKAVNDSKAVYTQFKAVYEDGNVTLDQLMDNNQWTDLQTDIENFLEGELKTGFEAGTLTADQLEEYQNKINTMVQEFVSDPSVIKEGDDLTILLANPHFTQGNGKGINTVPGWVVNNGSMTELRNLTHNIETWHAQFDISQTLHNMPAGVYDITLQGFARHDNTAVKDKTWLYGGINTEYLISLDDDEEQMRDTPIFASGMEDRPTLGDSNYDNTASNGMYKANGMTGAYYWFKETNPNTGEPYYTNHVKLVLDEDGDFTIGIHCEATEDWVIFDNFRVKYTGMDTEIFKQMVEKKQTELQELIDEKTAEDPACIPTDVQKLAAQKLNPSILDDIDSSDKALAEIDAIKEVINKVNESVAVFNDLGQKVEFFEYAASETPVSDDFNTLLGNARDNLNSGYATLDAMKADAQQLAENWAGAVSQNLEAGEDATACILNPDYDGLVPEDGELGVQFWNNEGANPGLNFNCCEFFNTTFIHSQTMKGLKPGYYTVTVDGFYRYGDFNANETAGTPGAGAAHADGTEVLNAVMFVESAAGNNSVALKSIFEGVQTDLMGVGGEVEANGVTGYIPNNMEAAEAYLATEQYTNTIDVQVGEDGVLTIGIRKDEGITNDWTIFNNWTLTYLGTEAPDAVQGIETVVGNTAIYGIDGRQQSQLRRGINIVRQNGKVQKVLVK